MLRVVEATIANKARQSVGRRRNSAGFAVQPIRRLTDWLMLTGVTILNWLMLAIWYGR